MANFDMHSQEEVDDLIAWLAYHPADVDLLKRAEVTQLLVLERRRTTPCVVDVPESLVEALDALIEDWCEVLHAHGETFHSVLHKPS